jgi:hypothetical protein
MYFTGKYDGPSIEYFLNEEKLVWKEHWRGLVNLHLQGDVTIWWNFLDYNMIRKLSDK